MAQYPRKTEKSSILFVDDSQAVLDGISRTVRARHSSWEIRFATSADEAMRILEKFTCEIVISDLKMPGTNGCQLLEQVRHSYPDVFRVVFSGQVGKEAGMQVLKVAHRFLAKPCPREELVATVDELLVLQNRLGNGLFRKQCGQIALLPSLPDLYWKIRDELNSNTSSVSDLAVLLSREPAVAAKVLQLANSSFFSTQTERTSSIYKAISRVGFSVLAECVAVVSLVEQFDVDSCPNLDLETLWSTGIEVATLAKQIARSEGADQELQDACYLAGILHGIGRLVFAVVAPREYNQLLASVPSGSEKELDREKEVFGASHPEVGAYLLGIWGIPTQVISAIMGYRKPLESTKATKFSPLLALHAAWAIAGGDSARVNLQYLEETGLHQRFQAWTQLNNRGS